ncbi:HupE/UreJ family protein [Maricaulis sp.]|uniref:HupE/UreJ family protein n=1 Tax=Maricaulis sp. TaxID=1486257 RepID=UPI001B23992C|nr:HupE/UreJ family protein [Maricaulis sp.]MBO6797873.1 HupE/UreJ family protein [Maricaulis sp.]
MPRIFVLSSLVLMLGLMVLGAATAWAHPEDEICRLDPDLCAALESMDSELPSGEAALGFDVTLERGLWETIALYVKLGFEHILPKGLDHILFVCALFFASTRLKPLVLQVSSFTIAHTITLGLAISGLIVVPGQIVEPIIALSIAFVAVENILFKDMQKWRPLVVFGFGLFHGLGFAGVLSELGLPGSALVPALVSFNVGVELGQLTIIAAMYFALRWFFEQDWYRSSLVRGANGAIALMAIWWTIERVFLGG